MSALKKIRDFRAPVDDATANELRRQLGDLEQNVSDMGNAIRLAAMQRLVPNSNTASGGGLVLAPGQFQLFDTRTGTINAGLAKPKAADAGTFIVAIDVGGGAGNLYLRTAAGCTVDAVDFTLVNSFGALLFCDGSNYWRLV